MSQKENKGGLLSNEEVEQDLKAKGKDGAQNWYAGSQDTGDNGIRQMGTAVQQRDGQPDDEGETKKGN